MSRYGNLQLTLIVLVLVMFSVSSSLHSTLAMQLSMLADGMLLGCGLCKIIAFGGVR